MDAWHQREMAIVSNRQDAQDQALSQLHRIADEKGFIPEKRMAVRPLHPEGMKALGNRSSAPEDCWTKKAG